MPFWGNKPSQDREPAGPVGPEPGHPRPRGDEVDSDLPFVPQRDLDDTTDEVARGFPPRSRGSWWDRSIDSGNSPGPEI
jgi:hypothetical protein